MRFVVDAQLPPALARRLEALGHTAEHVADRGMAAASDKAIRDYAASVGAAIVTKDEDFAVRRVLTEGPAVVWLRLDNARRVADPRGSRITRHRGRARTRRDAHRSRLNPVELYSTWSERAVI